ncbi:MAG: HDOD domain-containing protein [bacterium]|nr:HDOD domain-containing protein [bacterium]
MIDEKGNLKEILVTRHPIFDMDKEVFAYELMFKADFQNSVRHLKGDESALKAFDGFLINGLKILAGGKKVFINFKSDMLLTEMPFMFPSDLLGIGILESLKKESEKKLTSAIKKLKDSGYMLMLSEEAGKKQDLPLIGLADIIGKDFRTFDLKKEYKDLDSGCLQKVKFLAKSVETAADYDTAVNKGYKYFQGSFFSKADLVPVRNIPSYKINFLRLLKEINKPSVQFNEIEEILKKDVSITYKLLRYINSTKFGFKNSVESIRHALTLLGDLEIRKWLSLIILSGTGTNKPQELIKNTIIRAKFCEFIASVARKKELPKFFLMGMFSMVDAFLDRPLEETLLELPLDAKVKAALNGEDDNRFRRVLDVALDYERGDWENLAQSVQKLKLDEKMIGPLYLEAVQWAS